MDASQRSHTEVGGRQQLDEIYFVQKVKLGQGSFGSVWRAKHRQSGETVSTPMKQMDKASMPKRGVTRHDIEREVKMMKAALWATGDASRRIWSLPNWLIKHDCKTTSSSTKDSGSIYLALEYCDGGDFGDKAGSMLLEVITEARTAEWMRQMCHPCPDLTVSTLNVSLCKLVMNLPADDFSHPRIASQSCELKLADFGLAVYVRPGAPFLSDVLTDKCGTPAFMSPEQHLMPMQSRGYGFPCDMWAAGVSMCAIRVCCNRPAESGDALDSQGKPWPYKQTEDSPLHPKRMSKISVQNIRGNYVNFMMGMTFAGFPPLNPSERQIPFAAEPSPMVEGLGLLEHSQSNTEESMKQAWSPVTTATPRAKVIVGSVRMGYGHHRIAYSALTWALELGGKPFLLAACNASWCCSPLPRQYSRMSRIASNLGGVIDAMWGKMMLQAGSGDANALRCCLALAQKIRGIMAAFPKDTPVISSHPIVGNMAVACGFTKVINLIFDNYPQWLS
eukprot:Skav222675  [mRNA]  locus=scaffold997:699363:708208:- [translate_table: standard]